MRITQPRRYSGFTVIDLMAVGAVLVIVVVLGLVVLSSLGTSGNSRRQMPNNTQLRGIHLGMVTYAQSNKRGGNDGFFPGLDSTGMVIPDGPDTGHSGDGTQPGARLWMLLDGNYFTPEYLINPSDPVTTEVATNPATGEHRPLTADHYSYALSAITATTPPANPDGRTAEWKETLNTAAIVLGDRAIGTGPTDISSVWTPTGSGDWRGGVVRNDNSTSFETDATGFEQTKYANHPANALDKLFEDETGGADAFLVHDDAVTAYSAE